MAMIHDHGVSGATLVGATGVVAAVSCAVCAAVAIFHLRRFATAAADRKPVPISVEAGHLAVAVGMAVMFAAPHSLAAPGYSWGYLGVALTLLMLIIVHPHSGHPSHWWCHAMLFVDALAMALMSGPGGWWSAELAGWFVAVFLVAGLVAAGRIVLYRISFADIARVVRSGGGSSPTPAGSQLAMSAGMLVMLL